MAARTYSGTWSAERYREQEAALRRGLAERQLEPAGEPVWARFNSPWSLWFMRRNEVQMTVSQTTGTVEPDGVPSA